MPFKQKGISLVTGLVILVFVALLAITVIRIIPLYYDNYVVNHILEKIKVDPAAKNLTSNQLKDKVFQALQDERIQDVSRQNISVERLSRSMVIDIKYERRTRLFYNIDAVVSFSNHLEKANTL